MTGALIDLAPAVLFFTAYVSYGLYTATAVLIAACIAVVIVQWWRTRRVPRMQLVTAVIVAIFGGLTLWLRNPEFIKFKPTALYGLFAAVLLASHFIGGKVLLARIPQKQIVLPEPVWRRVNFAWAMFFIFCAVLNLYVAANYSEAVWVKLKAFGFSLLMLAFLLAHAPFLARYLEEHPKSGGNAG